ncbi:MAG: PrsW family intramembrane metalloprotease [Chloroflexi bacterium]|nr:PrsW family intramembrane metalloprotease [Chloroflexota bacterium]
MKRNVIPPLVAVGGGVLGIIGAIFQEGRQGIPSAFLGPFFAGPVIEEAVKPIGVYILLARAPQLLRSRPYTAFLSALGGLSFAVIENLAYLNFYFPDHTEALVVARFAMALPMHVLASFIAGFGVNQRLADSVWGKVPFLSGNWKFFISAMALHSGYNISAVFWGSAIK